MLKKREEDQLHRRSNIDQYALPGAKGNEPEMPESDNEK